MTPYLKYWRSDTNLYESLVSLAGMVPLAFVSIVFWHHWLAQLPESLQKALSVNYDSIRPPEPVYRPTGKEQYALEVKEYSFKIFVINEKEEWQTFPLTTTLY